MNNLIMVFEHFDMGGLQTLMVRISMWCKRNDMPCVIIYKTIDDKMSSIVLDLKLNAIEARNPNEIVDIIGKHISFNNKNILMTFEIQDFILLEKIRKKKFNKYDFKHIYYSVSVGSLIRGKEFKGCVGKIIYEFYRGIVFKYYKNRNIYFMDDDTRSSAIQYYNIENGLDNIILLPMDINDAPQYDVPEKNILTVARADFPFKGYLIGLIHDFEKISNEFPDARLIVVSFGKDINLLKDAINNNSANEKITLYEGLQQSEINNLLKNTYLYVGMGTTVLDAANMGVPALTVYHNTMKNLTCGFFYENPPVLGRKFINEEGNPSIDYIYNTLRMNEKQYLETRRITFEAIKEYYDINTYMAKILGISVSNSKVLLSNMEFMIHDMLYGVRNLRRKIFKIR